MKKLLAATVLASTLPMSGIVLADTDIGCGFGTMIFDGSEGKVPKILAATTNGLLGNQTFGITFGTLGCDGTGKVTSAEKLTVFIDGNIDNLARDIAKGQGETLATLAEIWGLDDADKAKFNSLVQQNFAHVFVSENVTSKEVFVNLNQVMSKDTELAGYAI
ncbi:hypothetical protein GCM10007938_37790 [Vibrio zhanjiangensis]|uniref:DUF3015 domain-containing protein n=1 Tax=Vibrio zhanjiangensis TaxID=1046128 RepID=A0ABQ6F598_9VIBR|nr:DUF3015 domain-containing protein [Vibrio zhanjiangensis]GLT19996.1 hypothetical protein GCM10007938_37790 [Vibrio zhanjiangensis]